VQSTATGATLYQHNAMRVFMPASTLKLFTGAAAISYLGPNFVFPTQLLTNAQGLQNGVLPGDLYVKFTGDPQLSVQDLDALISTLSRQGIRQIRGNLVIDDTDMDRINWGPGWMWDDQNLCYAAPATAIVLNRNCFGFNIAPAHQAGELAQVHINQTLANISIINQLITRTAYTWQCPMDLRSVGNNTYALSGCIGPRHPPMSLAVAVNDPHLAGKDMVMGLLNRHGIVIAGQTLYGKAPNNLRILAQHDSQPLSVLVTRMLKKSDDLIADLLFKKVGGTYFNTTGNWSNGALAVRSLLGPRAGIDFNKLVLVDGAGLSRYNWISPLALAKLLNYAYHSMPNNTLFYQALPISGVDGTLRYRMGGAMQGHVHAKTGTMHGISGLAGYVQTFNHQTLTFAILVNGFVGNQATYHMLEDRICQFLAENNSISTTAGATPKQG
jgi:D-alanyl-D-alanine carboxypeptidase/D-alanyl-D-alanine-endopeptidase (penicillin-binding protein 4)